MASKKNVLSFQDIIFNLQSFWSNNNCTIIQPIDLQVGAGTFHPATVLGALGKKIRNIAYVQPTRRPTDGRYGKNPNRLQHYYQFQVLLKPSPKNIQSVFLRSLKSIGIDPKRNNIQFKEDDWESPTLGASGLGWEVRCNGMEICQYTYFQQIGGIECNPVSVEITYGLERLAMFIQKVNNVFDIVWNINKKEKKIIKYKDIYLESEKQFSKYNFELANTEYLFKYFEYTENECKELLSNNLPLPAYENCIKASHYFNILDARGVIGVTQRQSYILKIRSLVKSCCEIYIKQGL